jgi:hypothetical protein
MRTSVCCIVTLQYGIDPQLTTELDRILSAFTEFLDRAERTHGEFVQARKTCNKRIGQTERDIQLLLRPIQRILAGNTAIELMSFTTTPSAEATYHQTPNPVISTAESARRTLKSAVCDAKEG